jgi:hypothetical protein
MKRVVTLVLVFGLVLMVHPALGKKKPKVKPYKSEEVSVGLAHPVFFGQTGAVNTITAKEFENTCAVPSSNGVDAYVFEVPAPYQTITATVAAIGSGAQTPAGYDLDIYMYDKDCKVTTAANAEGTDENGIMPAGTAWLLVQNYLGEPQTSFHIELAPYKAPTF